jgi:PAS domain S-box-containing protein
VRHADGRVRCVDVAHVKEDKLAAGLAPRAVLAVPLLADGKLLGKLTFGISESAREFTAVDRAFAREIARRAARAMQNARLHTEERRARAAAEQTADRLTRLQTVTSALSRAATPTEVAGVIVQQAAEALGAAAGVFAVLTADGQSLEVLRTFGVPRLAEGARFALALEVPLAAAVRSATPVVIGSPDQIRACYPLFARLAPVRPGGLAAAPLLIDGRALGGFQFCFPEGRHPHDLDRGFLLMLAQLAAQALERSRLLESAENARRQLAESEARLRRLTETAMLGVGFFGIDGTITYANEAVLRITGYDRGDVAEGRLNWRRITPPEYRLRDDEGLAEMARNGFCVPYEKEYVRKDGRRVPILMGAALFDGSEYAGVGFIIDLTERKRVEHEHASLVEQDRSFRERLMGIVGHDLRTPLTAIVGSTQLLQRRRSLAPAEVAGVERIARSAERMLRMIDQLVDFALARQGGGFPVTPTLLDLGWLCREVVDELRLAHPAGRIAVSVEGDVRGEWDRDRLEQVVSNLVSNALQHGQGSPVEVRVVGDGDEVRVRCTTGGRRSRRAAWRSCSSRIGAGTKQCRGGRRGTWGWGFILRSRSLWRMGGALGCRRRRRRGRFLW